MHIDMTLFCDPRLAPALTWLDSCRGRARMPTPPDFPLPWPPDWAHGLQTRRHVFFDGSGLELNGHYLDGLGMQLVCSLLPLVDHAFIHRVNNMKPSLRHGGILEFPDGSSWRASPAQELRLACLYDT